MFGIFTYIHLVGFYGKIIWLSGANIPIATKISPTKTALSTTPRLAWQVASKSLRLLTSTWWPRQTDGQWIPENPAEFLGHGHPGVPNLPRKYRGLLRDNDAYMSSCLSGGGQLRFSWNIFLLWGKKHIIQQPRQQHRTRNRAGFHSPW